MKVFFFIVLSYVMSFALTYSDRNLINIGYENSDVSDNYSPVAPGGSLKQSFIPRSKDPLAIKVQPKLFFFKPSRFTIPTGIFKIYKGDINENGTLIHSQPISVDRPVDKASYSLPDQSHLIAIDSTADFQLEINTTYYFEINIESLYSSRALGLYNTSINYLDGSSLQTETDIWFKMIGDIHSSLPTNITFDQAPGNQFYFDRFSHQIPNKLIGKNKMEGVIITKPTGKTYTYITDSPEIISITNPINISNEKQQLNILGLKKGEATIYILDQTDTISLFHATVLPRNIIDVSYSYIQYPGESQHEVKNKYNAIALDIQNIYDSANVKINFHNQGTLTYEWDLDGDGTNWGDNGNERRGAFNSGIFLNPNDYFSNLYIQRHNKDDSYVGGSNGEGSSSGFGQYNSPPRSGYKAVHLSNTTQDISSTLAHELGHNLGLYHYSSANAQLQVQNDHLNMMKTGRLAEKMYSFQWKTIHNTIEHRQSLGENYDKRTTPTIQNFADKTLEASFTFTPQASTNSDAPPFYRVLTGEENIRANTDGSFTLLQAGITTLQVIVPESDSFLSASKTITLNIEQSQVSSSVIISSSSVVLSSSTVLSSSSTPLSSSTLILSSSSTISSSSSVITTINTCEGIASWDSSSPYSGLDGNGDGVVDGPEVVYNGKKYSHKAWWSNGNNPEVYSNIWNFIENCSDQIATSSSSAEPSSSSVIIPLSSSSIEALSSSSVTIPLSSSSIEVASSSSTTLSSSSTNENCGGLPQWEARSYGWVAQKEFVQYNLRKYSHQNWVDAAAPDQSWGWSDEGPCSTSEGFSARPILVTRTSASFELSQKNNYQVSIYDIQGERVQSFPITGHFGINEFSLQSPLENGVYYFKLSIGTQQSTLKIIVQQ